MKKFLSLLLLVVTVLALTACNPKLSLVLEDSDLTVTLQVGQTKTITPTVSKGNKLEWTSSSIQTATVSVSEDTLSVTIRAVEEGTAKITVKVADKDLSKEITVTVTRPAPTSVVITGAGDLVRGGTLKLSGAVLPALAKQELSWSSSNEAIATVDNTGLVTGVGAGNAVITAASTTVATVKITADVTVLVPQPTAVTVTGASTVVVPGTIDLVGTVAPEFAAQGVLWSVDNTALAEISTSGVLTALKEGTVVVTATSVAKTSVKGTKSITITLPDPIEVVVSGPQAMPLDLTGEYSAVVGPEIASQKVVWTVSDPTKASIDAETGKLTPIMEGTVKVIATSAALSTVKGELEVTLNAKRVHAEMVFDGFWPITGTDAFTTGEPVKSLATKGALNPTATEYYIAGPTSNHFTYMFIQDSKYKINPSVWQNRVFLNRNDAGFFEVKLVKPAGSANVNPTLSDYEYVLYAHSGNAGAYAFLEALEVGQILTINGFDINGLTGFDAGDITINAYTKAQAVSTDALYGPGGEELVLPLPGRNGYVFDGWYDSDQLTGEPIAKLDSSKKVYPKWKNDYTTIAVNNDAGIADETVYFSKLANKYFVKGQTSFSTLAEALAKVEENGTVLVENGEYSGAATVAKNGLTISGFEGSVISGVLSVNANVEGLTIKNLHFTGKAQIVVAKAGGVKNFTFNNNVVTDLGINNDSFIGFDNDGTADNENFVIRNNKFLLGEAIVVPRWVRGGNIKDFTVINNEFTGLSLEMVDAIRIEGTNNSNSAGTGLGGAVVVKDNKFNKNGQRGVWVRRISATTFLFENNLLDKTGSKKLGGGLQIEVLAPETVLEVTITKNEFRNIDTNFGIKLGTEATPTIGTVLINNNKFIDFVLGSGDNTADYIVGYPGMTNIDANNNFYTVLPTVADMLAIPDTAYATSFDTLKVAFVSLGGPEVTDQEIPVVPERKATEPAGLVMNGYWLEGWYLQEDFKTLFNFDTRIDYPINLYAKWTAIKYDIIYNLNGGDFGFSFNNKADMLVAFMDDLYEFIEPTESKTDFIHGVGKTSGYDGLWHSKEEYKLKIYEGPRPAAPNNEFFISHEDYMENWLPFFDNMQDWVKVVNSGQNFYNDTFVGFIRIRQYLMGTKPIASLTDAQNTMFPNEYKIANEYTIAKELILASPAKEKSLFLGWFDNAGLKGEAITSISMGSTGAIMLYAKWIDSVTVKFMEVGGTPIAVQQIVKNSKLAQPADPTKKGYTFVAWFTTADLTTEFVFDTAMAADVEIYAKWTEDVNALTYELNAGAWSWDVSEVVTPKIGINTVSTLPIIFMQDLYKYLKDNNLLESVNVDAGLHKTTWVEFSKSYIDPYAIYNWSSNKTDGGGFVDHQGYNQFFYDTATGNDETKEITEIIGGFFGTEPYKTKYANLASHLALMLPEKYSAQKFWGGPDSKGGMGFMMDGYFYGTQGAGAGKFLALRSVVPNTNAKFVFDGETLNSVDTGYQALNHKISIETKLVAPSRVGFLFEGWYTNAAFTGEKVESISAGSLPAAKYYAKWKDVRYDDVQVDFELNGGEVTSYVQATRYYLGDAWVAAAPIIFGANPRAYNHNLALKYTDVDGIYEVLGRTTGAKVAGADRYIRVHDTSTSPYKVKLIGLIAAAKPGDKIRITNIPAVETTAAEINITFILDPSTVMFMPSDLNVTPVREGYTFGGWYDNVNLYGEPVVTYPGFEGSTVPEEVKYYAKWTAPAHPLMISQAYGGGGNTDAPFRSDFVELYNPNDFDVDLTGWYILYASKTGDFKAPGSQSYATGLRLTGTIKSKGFYLIQMADGTNLEAAALPTPDAIGGVSMGGKEFKLALTCTSEVPVAADGANVIDFVGVSSAATLYEGTAAAPSASNTLAVVRATLADTNDNAADFTAAAPAPRNSAYVAG